MILKSLKNKKICILGYGIENQALVDFLIKKKVECEIVICDFYNVKNNFVILRNGVTKNLSKRTKRDVSPTVQNDKKGLIVNWKTGKNYDKNLDQYDIVFRIAGYPLFSPEIIKAKKKGVEISSPTKLFFDLSPSKNIIGVTGTKGKGTVSSLIAHIIKKSGKRVWFGGNIGIPMFSFLDKIKKSDFVVLELSSFQLEDLEKSPHISVITNFTPEHLASADPKNPNYHKSMAIYRKAKLNIVLHQSKKDYVVSNKELVISDKNLGVGKKIKSKKLDLSSNLVGEYNKENIGMAVEVVKILKIKKNIIKEAVKSFKGLPHRIEFVRNFKGVDYYDNSFATTPEATAKDIESFSELIILFLGGSDKGADFKKLAKEVKRKVKFVVLLDKALGTKRIEKELIKINYPKQKMKLALTMKEAVSIANKQSETGDIVLLSTACASFGIFKNYKDRGDQFKSQVKKLK